MVRQATPSIHTAVRTSTIKYIFHTLLSIHHRYTCMFTYIYISYTQIQYPQIHMSLHTPEPQYSEILPGEKESGGMSVPPPTNTSVILAEVLVILAVQYISYTKILVILARISWGSLIPPTNTSVILAVVFRCLKHFVNACRRVCACR